MATNISLESIPQTLTRKPARPITLWDGLSKLIDPFASMKLTLVLLAMAIFLVFVGTLAQAKAGMWEAISKYFTAWFVWVELQVFFPKAWFPEWHEKFTPAMGFPFFGGASIGLAMMINLLAAHLTRFRIKVRGTRLLAGLVAMSLGVLLTYVIVVLGDFQQGLRAKPLMSWEATAALTLVGAATASLGLLGAGVWYGLTAWRDQVHQRWIQAGLSVAGAVVSLCGCILLVVFFNDISALRILWQLIQGTVAGVVLLAGCWLLFDKRAGVVLLHGGVALMMVSQLLVSLGAREEQMIVMEGDTATFAQDIRQAELAVVENSDDQQRHTVIRENMLRHSLRAGDGKDAIISHEALPFDIKVERFFQNAELKDPEKADNLATAGIGLEQAAVASATGAGADGDSQVDMPAAYVTLLDKKTGEKIGTYLASVQVTLANFVDQVKVGGKTYDLALRFVRDYKPYSVRAIDVRKEDYPGSATPRKFESDIVLTDPRYGVEREVKIHMNNPFRYLGETFYQSNYRFDPTTRKEETTFQVVTNTGWMIPYVACMVVAVGMLYQFVQTLMTFILKEPEQAKSTLLAAAAISGGGIAGAALLLPAAVSGSKRRKLRGETSPEDDHRSSFQRWLAWFLPSPAAYGMVALSLVVIGAGLYSPKPKLAAPGKDGGKFDLFAFGELPVVAGGRAKPIDSLARESLLAMSNRTTYKTYYEVGSDGKEIPLTTDEQIQEAKEQGRKVKSRSHSATEWLLNTITKPEEAETYQVIRIENPEVIAALGLPEDREGFRFSIAELRNSAAEYDKQLEQIRAKDKDDLTTYDKKLVELDGRLQTHMRIAAAFTPRELPDLPKRDANDPEMMNEAIGLLGSVTRLNGMMQQLKPPLAVPITNPNVERIFNGEKWLPYSVAAMLADARSKIADVGIFRGEDAEMDRPTLALNNIFAAYAKGDAEKFNSGVTSYANWLEKTAPPLDVSGKHTYAPGPVQAEATFNHVSPFGWTQGILLYLLAFVVSALGLLAFRRSLGSAAFWMLLVIFIYHTGALIARMYISGRPPVTNLYSSAVFIGWFGVLAGLVLEAAFRLGIGNLAASVCGIGGLLIAYMLSFDGDTIGVEVAVLDTQFWLSTHVVCITIGYAATFISGILGVFYVLLGLFTPIINKPVGKTLARMIYGVVCFALFFSFVGTVLGGLWADDSWGRFWGWDPKENGALIIVLWNAFILHARWDKLANERGLAVLAVFGNIVTTWSWFGTNQLGVGLHSYGFTQGVLLALGLTVLVHLLIIGLGLLPKSWWFSYRRRDQQLSPA
jgi:ABC-type transport system involved in cytochrome c biogenesis permease subunit